MRITKTTAEHVAKKVLESKLSAYNKAVSDFKIKIHNLVYDQLPDLVKKTFEKHKSYLRTSTSFRFKSNGNTAADYSYYYANISLPDNNDQYSITISDEMVVNIQTIDKKLKAQKKEYDDAFDALVTALMQLGTYKRIKTELPDLEKYLPAETVTALVPNMDKIREIIKG